MVTDVCGGEKKEQEPKVACESVASTDAPAPGTQRVKTWGNDSVDDQKRWNWHTKAGWKMSWTLSLQRIWLRTCQATKQQAKAFAGLPIWKWTPWMKKHLFAALLVFFSTVVPMCILGASTQVSMSSAPFSNIFGDKVLSCGDSIGGEPQNATVTGIEKLFALDLTFGKFSFAQVKTIDIVWDLAIGRGLQVLAWWAAYIVFCDALLRAIERHPASFSIFQRIALEGPGLHSMWSLTKELWAAKSRRTKALFFYMFWSTAYVLFVPIVLGAMTGYDSTAIAWVDLDGSNNIIPASTLKSAWIITGTKNETWSEGTCESWELSSKFSRIKSHRKYVCNCQLPNGTILSPLEENQRFNNYHYTYGYYSNPPYLECKYNYPNQTKTWEDSISGSTYSCNATVPVTIKGKEYDLDDLSATSGWCYNSVAYNDTYLMGRSRCLPDTANQTYEWGFSTLMSGMFVFVTTGWAITMYIVWMDAQLNSSLVREGYRMTPLRAAFTIARAARRRMGMNDKALVRADTVALEKELYGKKGKKKTRIEYSIFAEDPEDGEDGWAKPPVRWPSSPHPSSTAQSEAGCGLLGENSVGSPVSSTPHGIDVLPGTPRDEELRMRYQKGVQEVMLSRKPVGR